MAMTVEVIKIGDELGFVIPDEVLARWGRSEGDTVYLTDTERGFVLAANDPGAGETDR